ncbi:MAG: hypothetical protein AAF598_07935 [Bacteroidota bacterium]
MKPMLLSYLFLMAFCALSTAQTQPGGFEPAPTPQSDWPTLKGEFYQVSYPADWSVNPGGPMGTTFFLSSPLTDDSDQFVENVNLLVQDLSGQQMDLDAYIQLSESQVGNLFEEGRMLSSKRLQGTPVNYHRMHYAGKFNGKDLEFLAYCWLIDEQGYVLTLTCAADQFANYQAIGEQILKSFKFLK